MFISESGNQVFAPVYPPICAHRNVVSGIGWTIFSSVRDAQHAAHQGDADLSANKEFAVRPVAVGTYEVGSTVRYLGIEVDDALEISEQTEV